jgi:hypothetical protein
MTCCMALHGDKRRVIWTGLLISFAPFLLLYAAKGTNQVVGLWYKPHNEAYKRCLTRKGYLEKPANEMPKA